MWPFGKSKQQKASEAIANAFEELIDEMKEQKEKHKEITVPCLTLLFTDGKTVHFDYDSVNKRNKEAAELRLAISDGNDWCYFNTKTNRQVFVDSRELAMVIEDDQQRCSCE